MYVYIMQAVQTQLLPEEVNNTLKVSGDQNHQRDDCGEDQGWGWSQPVDVSHGQNIGLRKQPQVCVKPSDNYLNTEQSNVYIHKVDRSSPCVLPWLQQSTRDHR